MYVKFMFLDGLNKRINQNSSLILISKIWFHLSNKYKLYFLGLLVIYFLSGFLEFASIAIVLPFLAVITKPEKLFDYFLIKSISEKFGVSNSGDLLLPITLLFVFVISISVVIRLLNIWFNNLYCAKVGTYISCKVFSTVLNQSYSFHIKTNSSIILTAITKQIELLISSIKATLQFITFSIISICLFFGLFFVDWIMALSATVSFSICYLLLAIFSRKKLQSNSEKIESSNKKRIKVTQESLGSIKDIILRNNQKKFLNIYKKEDYNQNYLYAQNSFISAFPRYAIEGFGLLFIACLSFLFLKSNIRSSEYIPILGALALGAQKLLPSMQQTYGAWATVKSSSSGVKDVLQILNKPQTKYLKNKQLVNFDFNNSIELKDICFSYKKTGKNILKSINLTIKKGERIGIIGSTGSGKSTLIDIFLCLLSPDSGEFLVDQRNLYDKKNENLLNSWRASIGHVPQDIYLMDASFAENIAFCDSEKIIDYEKVKVAARKAQIHSFIKSTNLGYFTNIGERGVKLSGGQKQRIGIARALYLDSNVLIFDEATSSLDNETEKEIIKSIEGLSKDLTIIMVAHRLSTLTNCDRLISIKNGIKINEGPPKKII